MRNELQPAVDPEQILSPWHREILTTNAIKLYEACWHRMKNAGKTSVWLDDSEASVRARILIRNVPNARAELINIGLLECWQGSRQWSYGYVESDDASVVGADSDY
jgi:hypothetical protein